jgi:hypothetical protein
MAKAGYKRKRPRIKCPQFLGRFNNSLYRVIRFQQQPVTYLPTSQDTIDYKGPVRFKIKAFTVNVPKKGGGEFGNFRGHGERGISSKVREF